MIWGKQKDEPPLIPRVKCSCGWYNNKPLFKNEDKAVCRKCGKLVNEKERFKREFANFIKKRKGEIVISGKQGD